MINRLIDSIAIFGMVGILSTLNILYRIFALSKYKRLREGKGLFNSTSTGPPIK